MIAVKLRELFLEIASASVDSQASTVNQKFKVPIATIDYHEIISKYKKEEHLFEGLTVLDNSLPSFLLLYLTISCSIPASVLR